MSVVTYGRSDEAWEGFESYIKTLITTRNLRSVCDIGAGANPLLDREFIEAHELDYTILDISDAELAKAPGEYHKVVADIASRNFPVSRTFDIVVSKMLAEHVRDGERFHRNVLSILNDDGLAVHFFPTLYSFPFVVNWLVPERAAHALYRALAARDPYQNGKFPAYYRWCRGPTRAQIERLSALGYDVVEYRGYFGHARYYTKLGPLGRLHAVKTDYLVRNPNPHFTSYAQMVLSKSVVVRTLTCIPLDR